MATRTIEELRQQLWRLDGAGYPAYRSIQGLYRLADGAALIVDHVQGDPFAAPSRLRLRVPHAVAGFPAETRSTPSRRVALGDFVIRAFAREAHAESSRAGSGGSGQIEIDAPGQEIIERSAVVLDAEAVEARFTVGLPAAGRRILGREAAQILTEALPRIAQRAMRWAALDQAAIGRWWRTNEDADRLRAQLDARGLVAFVADGAVLPRASGASDRPLRERAIGFASPESLRVGFELPHRGRVSGLGVPKGVTLIVGGGFHGKSTLLNALERGVYNHIPGDGRELVVAAPLVAKIRAEAGRSVAGVDISPFIDNLPFGQPTRAFSTPNASGSTSQAANIMEAIEAGATVLLIDEDTSASNLLFRDARMERLIAPEREPITPLLDRIVGLWRDRGVSTVMVMGGSGAYFDVADTVIALEAYVPRDATADARAVAATLPLARPPRSLTFPTTAPRVPLRESLDPSRGRRDVSLKARGLRQIAFGEETIELDAVEQLVSPSQVRAIGEALLHAWHRHLDNRRDIPAILDAVERDLSAGGLDALANRDGRSGPRGDLARFRRLELAAALNRLRSLRVR